MYINCHTYYSFKYGTLSVAQLLAQAQQLGVTQFVLSDINNTSAVLDFVRLSKKYNISESNSKAICLNKTWKNV